MSVEDRVTPAKFLVPFKEQLVARLAANEEFADVKVFTQVPTDDVTMDETIVLWHGRIREEHEHVHPNQDRNAVVSVPGFAQTYSLSEISDEGIEAAMQRVSLILGQIIDELKTPPVVGRGTREAILGIMEWVAIPSADGGWVCRVYTSLDYDARVA